MCRTSSQSIDRCPIELRAFRGCAIATRVDDVSHGLEDDAPRSEHGVLPIAPIERPRGLFVRLLYWATRRRYGKTPTAFRVVYSRAPGLALVSFVLVFALDRLLSIGRELRFLIQVGSSMQIGCTFCSDLVMAEAARHRIGRERFAAILDFESSKSFTERERAALAYVASVTESVRVPDAIFERLREHFSAREIVEIVWVCAAERYFNTMALPLRIGSDHLARES